MSGLEIYAGQGGKKNTSDQTIWPTLLRTVGTIMDELLHVRFPPQRFQADRGVASPAVAPSLTSWDPMGHAGEGQNVPRRGVILVVPPPPFTTIALELVYFSLGLRANAPGLVLVALKSTGLVCF
jgi:hypothetical protein